MGEGKHCWQNKQNRPTPHALLRSWEKKRLRLSASIHWEAQYHTGLPSCPAEGHTDLSCHCQEADIQYRHTTADLLGLNLLGANSSVWSAHLGSSSRTFQISRFIFQPYKQIHWLGSIQATTRVVDAYVQHSVSHKKRLLLMLSVCDVQMQLCRLTWAVSIWLKAVTHILHAQIQKTIQRHQPTNWTTVHLSNDQTQNAHDCTLQFQPYARSIACQ